MQKDQSTRRNEASSYLSKLRVHFSGDGILTNGSGLARVSVQENVNRYEGIIYIGALSSESEMVEVRHLELCRKPPSDLMVASGHDGR